MRDWGTCRGSNEIPEIGVKVLKDRERGRFCSFSKTEKVKN